MPIFLLGLVPLRRVHPASFRVSLKLIPIWGILLPSSLNFSLMTHSMNTSVACVVGPSVTTFSTDFSFQNVVFGNLFEFSAAEIILKSISLTF